MTFMAVRKDDHLVGAAFATKNDTSILIGPILGDEGIVPTLFRCLRKQFDDGKSTTHFELGSGA